ncbi:hypothetical protein AAE478_008351 [Parahypoxylon ruwenzoriense]
MAPPTSVLSRTMQSISLVKIREIEKQREQYEARKQEVLASVDSCGNDMHKSIACLFRGIEELNPEAMKEPQVKNIRFWLQQSRHDGSVPEAMLQSSEKMLREKLEVRSRRLALAHLYSRLMTEWMESASRSPIGIDNKAAALPSSDDESFDTAKRQKERLQDLCDKFERMVFEPLETDELEIDLYLRDLFEGDNAGKALEELRKTIGRAGENLVKVTAPFNETKLNQCISGLMVEDLLSDEKQALLRSLLENRAVLREMVDVLNMRFAEFENWGWQAGEQGIPVLPRQQLNGKYRIWMDEDVLQAIFIHYVGMQCCVDLKEALCEFVSRSESEYVWNWQTKPKISEADEFRRRYYLGCKTQETKSVVKERNLDFINDFFLSQLPASFDAFNAGMYINDGALDENQEINMSSSDKEVVNVKQKLLRTLASEVILQRSLNDEVALLQSDLRWYATGLSHTTIFAVMRFFGIPETIITFFRKVLRAPLNMNASSDNPSSSSGPRVRQRGVPMAHAPEKLIGELILFVMDLVVNRETGMLLYRLHDDLFLCGEPARCASAWKAMTVFARVMGVDFNMHKTGSVYLTDHEKSPDPEIADTLPKGVVRIGHLILDPTCGDWIVDQEHVNDHVVQLKKQLAACTSVLDWVRTWNSCMSRFFSHTFGEPAFCFGTRHVDSILETYQHIQTTLFGSEQAHQGNVVDHLKGKIRERLGVQDIPDAFFYLPENLGGLGLRNPFIPLLVIREDLGKDGVAPINLMENCIKEEKEIYEKAKKAFYELTVEQRLARLRQLTRDEIAYVNAKKTICEEGKAEDGSNTFFSFEEHMRWCENTSRILAGTYRKLLSLPRPTEPKLDDDVKSAIFLLGNNLHHESAKAKEAKWVLQMYADELRTEYGGMRLVEEKYLPLGVLAMLRRNAVRWNMIL